MVRVVDTHAHVYPSEHLDAIEALGVDPASTKIARGMHADATTADMTARLEWMDRAGVDAQVLSVMPQGAFSSDAEAVAGAAASVNDIYARLIEEYPGRFFAYAHLPLPHVTESIAEIRRILEVPSFLGASVPTVFPDGTALSDPGLDEIWAELDRQETVVNIHPTGQGACSPLIADAGLAWVNGAPVEDTTAVLHLLKADVPRRFPRIRFHIAHLGGDLAVLFQRLEDNFEDWGAFASSPQAALRSMWFDAANFYEPALRLALEAYGRDKVMAGSDHPYFQNEKYVRAFDYVRSAAIEGEAVDAILGGNAAELYRW